MDIKQNYLKMYLVCFALYVPILAIDSRIPKVIILFVRANSVRIKNNIIRFIIICRCDYDGQV